MYKFLTKNGQLLSFVVGAAISVLFILIASSGIPDGFDQLDKKEQFATGSFDFGLYASIFLTIIAFGLMIAFGVFQMATNPKGAIKGIAGIVAIAVIFLIAYNMGDGTVTEKWASDFDVTENVSRYVSGAMTTTLILGIIAVAALVISEVRNFFK
ncbi:MAG: hypothetical protein KDC24_03375 [Saprospiraceae bacterium]|nr:hypothetical protein [Saprospiraceae bacterium]